MESRYLKPIIQQDAFKEHKMAFLSGPRQIGKTSLASQLILSENNYFNWDEKAFSRLWVQDPLRAIQSAEAGPIVLDEIHKYRRWKNSLKGLYDRIGRERNLIVTGSARLDLYQKGGDSLLGRYLPYRLHPFTVSERIKNFPHPDRLSPQPIHFPLNDLMQCSGFPEPLLRASRAKAKRWSRLRLQQLIREDIRDFKNIRDLTLIQVLVELLPQRVGSPLSLNSLRVDLEVAYATLREWMQVLNSLFVCFQVPPYFKNIARALKKESKYYLYDWLSIESPGALLENIVASHLLKVCDFWTDTAQGWFQLCYIRTKDQLEVDFCILRDKKPWMLVECKSNDEALSPALIKMSQQFPQAIAFQLTQKKVDRKILGTKIRLMNTEKFLSMFI